MISEKIMIGGRFPYDLVTRDRPTESFRTRDFHRYQGVSATIMKVFSDFSPDVEALSLDEAFLDMTGSEQLFGDPHKAGGTGHRDGQKGQRQSPKRLVPSENYIRA
jgi:impB/mucB/samB family protein